MKRIVMLLALVFFAVTGFRAQAKCDKSGSELCPKDAHHSMQCEKSAKHVCMKHCEENKKHCDQNQMICEKNKNHCEKKQQLCEKNKKHCDAHQKICPHHKPVLHRTIAGFRNPESVVRGIDGKVFYVSNLGAKLDPMGKDGDGFISAVSAEGAVIKLRQFTGLNAPKGMAVVGNILYVADIDRVVGFDLTSNQKVFESSLAVTKTKFLNDITTDGVNSILVSATDLGKIYRVSLKKKDAFKEIASVTGVNGLYRDGGKVYAVSFGADMKLNGQFGIVSGNKLRVFKGSTAGGYDGVFRAGKKLYLTNWVAFGKNGVVEIYDLKKHTLKTVETKMALRGPADFSYDANTGMIWLPAMMEGKVHVLTLH